MKTTRHFTSEGTRNLRNRRQLNAILKGRRWRVRHVSPIYDTSAAETILSGPAFSAIRIRCDKKSLAIIRSMNVSHNTATVTIDATLTGDSFVIDYRDRPRYW